MLRLSDFELYSRWVPLFRVITLPDTRLIESCATLRFNWIFAQIP